MCVRVLKHFTGMVVALLAADAIQAAPLTIAVDDHFPPFLYLGKDKQPAGLGIDLLHAAAQRAGLELVFAAKPFAQVQQALETGEADAIFPLAPNAQRRERFDFSEALVSTGGALFVRHPEATPASLHALHDQSILTPQTGPLASYIRRTTPNITVITTQDYDDTLKRLLAGEARAAALNLQVGRQLVAERYAGQITLPQRYFWEVPLAVAVLKNAPDQTNPQQENLVRLSAGIRAMQADGSRQALIDAYKVFVP